MRLVGVVRNPSTSAIEGPQVAVGLPGATAPVPAAFGARVDTENMHLGEVAPQLGEPWAVRVMVDERLEPWDIIGVLLCD